MIHVNLPRFAILLCTYFGEEHLHEQLVSLMQQTMPSIALYISDDSLSDLTMKLSAEILSQSSLKYKIQKGPQKGFCRNFLSMAENKTIRVDFYAFCDQDDIWKADKLERAYQALKNIPEDIPAVYMSRTELISPSGRPIGFSPLFSRPPSFRNAIVQSLAGGNTQVFNAAAKILFEKTAGARVVSHDWWLYQLVTGAGGIVIYDSEPSILYRQHNENIVGANSGILAKLSRLNHGFKGRFRTWNDINTRALLKYEDILNDRSRQILHDFCKLRNEGLFSRLALIPKTGIYRQTRLGMISLWVALILGKF